MPVSPTYLLCDSFGAYVLQIPFTGGMELNIQFPVFKNYDCFLIPVHYSHLNWEMVQWPRISLEKLYWKPIIY